MRPWRYHIDVASAIEEAADKDWDALTAGPYIGARIKREIVKLPERLRDELLDIAIRLEDAEEIQEIDDLLEEFFNYADAERIWVRAESDPRDWHPPRSR